MKKVININFQGRVIPIEEPAYENLKKYVDSLRNYFSNEEGKEEIINDIENRIAELFNEKIKAGASFITEEHVEGIVSSIGRPEQFDEISMKDETASTSSSSNNYSGYSNAPRGSLFRNSKDKLIGGVCSGMAAYFRIDTSIIRVLFVLIAFGSFGTMFLLYIILWAILPKKEITDTTIRRKLYRDPDHKVIGGVLSGIAQYFDIQVWIPRLIFLLPVVFGVFKNFSWFFFFPYFNLFSGSLVLTYIILWAVIPKAITASEKMEMKGERVDLESIKNKIQDELQGVKKNIDENKDQWKSNIKNKSSEFAQEVNETARPAGRRFLRFIGAILKIFVFFILGIIALALLTVGTVIFYLGTSLMPLKYFIANGGTVQMYAWGTLILFIILPIIALLFYLIRRIVGVKSNSNWFGWTFTSLWILGWFSAVMLVTTISKEYKRSGDVQENIAIIQPSNGKMKIMFKDVDVKLYLLDFDFDDDDDDLDIKKMNGLWLSKNEDSLLIKNLKIKLEKSRDDSFHLVLVKKARASSSIDADAYAEKISYPITQQDSILILPHGFIINDQVKFRNQQIIVLLEVPVGKEVYIDRKAYNLDWYNIRGGTRGLNINIDDDWDNNSWRPGRWYKMTESGIERIGGEDEKELDADDLEEKIDQLRDEIKKKEFDLKSIDIKIKDGDTTADIRIKSNASNNKAGSTEMEADDPSRNANVQILFRALNLLKLAR